jgi:hypothetical protein
MKTLHIRLRRWMSGWLTAEVEPHEVPLCDFDRLSTELRPGDVLLVEGRTRIAQAIRLITQSAWTHSALYIGRLHEIADPALRALVVQFYQNDHSEQLLIEAILGQGTRITPLTRYRGEHLRICRPTGLAPADAQRVAAYAIRRLGSDYDMRQLFDLARFFFPWGVLPRRWRSSLLRHSAGGTTRTVCSCLLAEAFASVDYPILPFVERGADGSIRLHRRDPRLYTPKDFDYSPYFRVVKYPFLGLDEVGVYRKLPWSRSRVVYSDGGPAFQAAVSRAMALPCAPAGAGAQTAESTETQPT